MAEQPSLEGYGARIAVAGRGAAERPRRGDDEQSIIIEMYIRYATCVEYVPGYIAVYGESVDATWLGVKGLRLKRRVAAMLEDLLSSVTNVGAGAGAGWESFAAPRQEAKSVKSPVAGSRYTPEDMLFSLHGAYLYLLAPRFLAWLWLVSQVCICYFPPILVNNLSMFDKLIVML